MTRSRRKPRRITGTCLAGVGASERVWYRNLGDGTYERFVGRQNMNPWAVANGEPRRQFICDLRQRDPIETCRPCVAYRNRAEGIRLIGELPAALLEPEWELMATDSDAFFTWLDEGWTSIATLARKCIPTDELPEQAAEYRRETMRRWRAAHPGADKRKRQRDRAAYMREYRKRNPVRSRHTREEKAESPP